uniref:TF-B3 domain-containing protein n=1 Tax=Manihot esculenta TaxID=3983 RepID=A0A2C9WAK8_MANES
MELSSTEPSSSEPSYDEKEAAEVLLCFKQAEDLLYLKHKKLDPLIAAALEETKSNKIRQGTKSKKIRQGLAGSNHGVLGQQAKPQPQPRPEKPAAKPQLRPRLEKPAADTFFDTYEPPEIPPVVGLDGLIGKCSKPFEKQLTSSDVRPDQSRLTMNKADVVRCLLPLLNREEENPCQGIKVKTYDMQGNEYDMAFKLWASKVYVLTTGWKNFFIKHGLIENEDFVTIWMFRNLQTNKLCFVISSRRLPIYEPIKRRRG